LVYFILKILIRTNRISYLKCDGTKEVRPRLTEWKCVLVGHHDNVGKTIEEFEKLGWRLHSYVCAGNAALAMGTNHYLLFER